MNKQAAEDRIELTMLERHVAAGTSTPHIVARIKFLKQRLAAAKKVKS